jgi:hypothetical protein
MHSLKWGTVVTPATQEAEAGELHIWDKIEQDSVSESKK